MATQRQVAEHLDLSDRWVRNLIEQRIFPASERGSGLDVDLCRILYIRFLRARADGRAVDPGDYETEKTRLTKAQADKTEIEVQELRCSVIRVEPVIAQWQQLIAAARARLLALPSKLAASIAAPDRQVEAQDLAQALVYEALSELAGDGLPAEFHQRKRALERAAAADAERAAQADKALSRKKRGKACRPESRTERSRNG